MASLQDKVVVITGASSGIGKAAAVHFAREGAKVVLAARRKERLDELSEAITKRYGTESLAVQTDVTQEEQVSELFGRATQAFGRVDILMNNAGRGLKAKADEMEAADWDAVFSVNVRSVFLCSRAAMRIMKQQADGGRIITISSIAGKFAGPHYSAYCASKHAVTGFMKSLAWEGCGCKVRCNTIHPARIDTEFFDVYGKRPARSQMLGADDFADFIIATAKGGLLRKTGVLYLNLLKRLYYMMRYSFGAQQHR